MKVVYSAQHLFQIHQIKHLLESAGIESIIRNEFLMGAAGELPVTECWPKLYVDDAIFEQSEKMVEQELQRLSDLENTEKPAWVCSACGETIEAQFEWCWNCGIGNRDK